MLRPPLTRPLRQAEDQPKPLTKAQLKKLKKLQEIKEKKEERAQIYSSLEYARRTADSWLLRSLLLRCAACLSAAAD